MARIKANSICNVVTGDDAKSYVRHDGTCAPEITVPHLRLRLSIAEAERLMESLQEALVIAKAEETH